MKSFALHIICIIGMLAGFQRAGGQTYVFARLQGSPIDISGWNPQGSCYVGNTPVGTGNSEVILTNATNSNAGSIFYQTPINLSACRKWYAEFDFRMYDGSQADGLSFCYLDNPPVGAVVGAGLGIPANANGLKICFDTYRNCGSDAMPKIEARWGTGYSECNGQPERTNNDGAIGFIRGNNYNHCKIEYNQGNISVYVNNVLYLTAFQTFNFPGYFGFTASTGGSTDRHSIKNAIIYTEMPPSFAGADAVICPNDSAQLGGALNPAYTYLWSPSLGLDDPTSSSPKVSLNNLTNNSYSQRYIVQTSFTTNPGCASQDTVDVLVRVKPRVDFNASDGCLPNALINFTDATTIGDNQPNNFIYSWNFGDPNASISNPNTSAAKNPTHYYNTGGPFTVALSATSVQGCKSDTIKQVATIHPGPRAFIQSAPQVCLGNNLQFTDASLGNGSTVTGWHWDFGDGTFSTDQHPLHQYSNAGNFTIKHWVENGFGCGSDTALTTVEVTPLPTVAFSFFASACMGKSIQFTDGSLANAGAITGWTWDFGDASTDNVQNPLHVFNAAGNLGVKLSVFTDKGCTGFATKPIQINPLPQADFSVLANCSGSDALFTNLSQLPGGSITDLVFKWKFSDPNATPANPDSSALTSPVHMYIAGGIYNVSLQATSPSGCLGIKTVPLTIGAKPQLILKWGNDYCSNRTQFFTDSSTAQFSALKKRTIYWDWQNAPSVAIVDNAPSPGKVYQNLYPTFGGNASKKVVIKNIAESQNGCLAERYDTLQLLPSPQLVFGNISPACYSPATFNVNAAAETSGQTGSGIYFGIGVDAAGLFSPVIAGVGIHNIGYKYTALNGCVDTAFALVTINPLPTVNASSDRIIISGGSALLDASYSADVLSVNWMPSQTLNDAAAFKPLASPTADTWYTVTGISNKGCIASDSVLVKVLPALKIPNVFSPNKDGINDVWNIPYLSSYLGCTMDIFTRHGQKIFSSTGYNQPWDGTFNGRDIPAGVYYYRLDIKNGKAPVSGSVTLLR